LQGQTVKEFLRLGLKRVEKHNLDWCKLSFLRKMNSILMCQSALLQQFASNEILAGQLLLGCLN